MKNKSWYVYLLRCENNNLYIGISKDPNKRLYFHKLKMGAYFTKQHRPIKIVYTEKYSSYYLARRREKQIKGWRREKKENLIQYGKPIIKNNLNNAKI